MQLVVASSNYGRLDEGAPQALTGIGRSRQWTVPRRSTVLRRQKGPTTEIYRRRQNMFRELHLTTRAAHSEIAQVDSAIARTKGRVELINPREQPPAPDRRRQKIFVDADPIGAAIGENPHWAGAITQPGETGPAERAC